MLLYLKILHCVTYLPFTYCSSETWQSLYCIIVVTFIVFNFGNTFNLLFIVHYEQWQNVSLLLAYYRFPLYYLLIVNNNFFSIYLCVIKYFWCLYYRNIVACHFLSTTLSYLHPSFIFPLLIVWVGTFLHQQTTDICILVCHYNSPLDIVLVM